MSTKAESPRPSAVPQRRFIKGPDSGALKTELNGLNKEIEKVNVSIEALTKQIDQINLDPKTTARRLELQAELKELISKQGAVKNERQQVLDQIKAIDASMKRKITEIQQLTSKNSFKSVKDIDARIASLDKLVDGGELKLVEERKVIKEMSSLRKLKKDFGSIEKQQESIDADKQKIADLKKKLNSIQNSEVQARFETISKELNQIQSSNETVLSKKSDLRTKRNKLLKERSSKYATINKLRSDFNEEYTKFKALLAEDQKKRDEEYKARQKEEKATKAKEAAKKQLEEASKPAFETEINSIHSLLNYFDPEYVIPKPKTFGTESFTTQKNAIRTVDSSDLTVLKKEQESFFAGTGGKKKKGKTSSKSKAFTVAPDIIIALGDLSIPLPTKQDEVPTTVQTLKETLTALEAKQDEQTKANIEAAKAKIAALEKKAEEETEEESKEESEN